MAIDLLLVRLTLLFVLLSLDLLLLLFCFLLLLVFGLLLCMFLLASRVTAKPAMRGHFKTGHGKVPGT